MRAATDPQFASDRKRYENIVNALSGELMKASRGGGSGSLEEIRHWREGALAANSGAEMRGAMRGAMDFLHGAMDASARKKSEGLKSQFEPTDLLSEHNKTVFERILTSDEKGGSPQSSQQPAAPGGSGGPASAAPSGNAGGVLNEARDAIKRGAPRDKVMQRLQQMGVDPSGL